VTRAFPSFTIGPGLCRRQIIKSRRRLQPIPFIRWKRRRTRANSWLRQGQVTSWRSPRALAALSSSVSCTGHVTVARWLQPLSGVEDNDCVAVSSLLLVSTSHRLPILNRLASTGLRAGSPFCDTKRMVQQRKESRQTNILKLLG
jgi:hypothetical protein